ncbi:MAG TPA: DUF2012 domain-containing protein, partial [Chitinophagaceae bacterium]|nr:DUF2012 domain-containing protein [Chitinophagaceae bacterium]
LFLAVCSYAGNDPEYGTIKGLISTNEGKPAVAVTVLVKGSNKSTITREDGTFSINRVPAGKYQLEVSLTGYETLYHDVVIMV